MSNLHLIYRMHINPDTGYCNKFEPIEYFLDVADAKKYSKLFELQTPVDLKGIVLNKYVSAVVKEV